MGSRPFRWPIPRARVGYIGRFLPRQSSHWLSPWPPTDVIPSTRFTVSRFQPKPLSRKKSYALSPFSLGPTVEFSCRVPRVASSRFSRPVASHLAEDTGRCVSRLTWRCLYGAMRIFVALYSELVLHQQGMVCHASFPKSLQRPRRPCGWSTRAFGFMAAPANCAIT